MIASVSTSALALLLASAPTHENPPSRLFPITAPIRRAGVYHVATGTWTRNSAFVNATGPDIIYNNTCSPVYCTRQLSGERFQHRSRIPSTSGPTTPSVFYGPSRNDEAPGCRDSYTVNGFEVAYCSSAVNSVDFLHEFASSFTDCASTDMVPQYSFALTGLPGGSPTGLQRCWIVDVDLSGTTPAIVLSADGDGTYIGPSDLETFGWSFGPTGTTGLADFTGPILAGDYTWTAWPSPLTPCSGTDGTIWDDPIHLSEEGTGMASQNFFRDTGTAVSGASGPGCYHFSPNLHVDFWLKLFADAQCFPPTVLTSYCHPGIDGIHACPCNNPPSSLGRSCDNFGQHTGGAQLSATGVARVSFDTLVFTSSFENDTAMTVLMQGTATANLLFGAGLRCVAGTLKRLYVGPAGNGDPPGTFHRPFSGWETVHETSLAKGYDIGAHAPVTLYYMAYYRDPQASMPANCNDPAATFNSSQALSCGWLP